MNIKRFIASNANEALKMVKKDMGPDAIILRTRTLPLSHKGLNHSHKKVEVTAAVDYEAPTVTSPEHKEMDIEWRKMERDLKEIKDALMLSDIGGTLDRGLFFNRRVKDTYKNYKSFGLIPEVIRDLMDEGDRVRESDDSQSKLFKESMLKVLSRIKVDGNGIIPDRRRIYSFIGPTGVGKTTTLAKLAALSAIKRGKKTALITIDTFRIAAAAQLETYARIMNIPMEVAGNSSDLRKAIQKHENCDRIYIDTAGRSPNNDHDIKELNEFLSAHDDIHSFLVLSATTRFNNLINTENRFEKVPFGSYIFTKLDETQDISTMMNFLITRRKPVSYFTTGQQVPEDIEIASRKKIASLIISGLGERPGLR